MAIVTKPKNVIPTVVYLRGNEVSRLARKGTTKYDIATDEQIQSIIDSFTPGGGGDDARYDIATDEQIQDIIDDWEPDSEEQPNYVTDEQLQEEDEEINSEEGEAYNLASDEDILNIIDEFNNNGDN